MKHKQISRVLVAALGGGMMLAGPVQATEDGEARIPELAAASYACSGTVFNDVNGNHWACGYIEEFMSLNITGGCQLDDPGTQANEAAFCPDDTVTRAQMAIFMVKGLEEALFDILSGPGSGLDADTLDGKHAADFLGSAIPLVLAGSTQGGVIQTTNNTDYGLVSNGKVGAAAFGDTDGTSSAWVALGGTGVLARGTGIGGRFEDSDASGIALVGVGDVGIEASGDTADVVLKGTANTITGDDGVIRSDPSYSSSDIWMLTNDGFVVVLDKDASGEDADFEIRDKDDNRIFNVDESGAVTYGAPGVAAFPRPAYNSGWVSIAAGSTGVLTLTHNLGGAVDNYVVDLQCKNTNGPHNWGMGLDGDSATSAYDGVGAAYWGLTSTSVKISRGAADSHCATVRLRVWMYN